MALQSSDDSPHSVSSAHKWNRSLERAGHDADSWEPLQEQRVLRSGWLAGEPELEVAHSAWQRSDPVESSAAQEAIRTSGGAHAHGW